MKLRLLCFCLLLGALVSCQQEVEPSPYQLYFTAGQDQLYGEAIVGEDYILEEGATLSVMSLMGDLLDGPTDSTLTNPFPSGTKLLWAEWYGDGIIRLNLSEEYGGLTGIALTQADYCIARTLCQIPGVEGVEILSANQENQFRNHATLRVEDIM